MPTKTFVEFDYPGTLFPESSVREVADRDVSKLDVPNGVFRFQFFDQIVTEVDGVPVRSGRLNISPKHYYGGRILTRDEVAAEFPQHDILLDNMRINGWDRLIRCRTQNFQPFEDGDVYVPERLTKL